MENRAKKELARKRLIIHSVLCALLPPVGMLLVWRSRYQSRFKLLMTLCSTLVLMAMFCVHLGMREPEKIVPPVISAGYAQQAQQMQQAEQPAQTDYVPSPAVVTPAPPVVIDDFFVAPANPNG